MQTLLLIRGIENLVIFIMLFVGAMALFRSKENGITKSLASGLLLGSCYVGLVFIMSLFDVCTDMQLRETILKYWVIVSALVIWGTLWLGWELIKGKYNG